MTRTGPCYTTQFIMHSVEFCTATEMLAVRERVTAVISILSEKSHELAIEVLEHFEKLSRFDATRLDDKVFSYPFIIEGWCGKEPIWSLSSAGRFRGAGQSIDISEEFSVQMGGRQQVI